MTAGNGHKSLDRRLDLGAVPRIRDDVNGRATTAARDLGRVDQPFPNPRVGWLVDVNARPAALATEVSADSETGAPIQVGTRILTVAEAPRHRNDALVLVVAKRDDQMDDDRAARRDISRDASLRLPARCAGRRRTSDRRKSGDERKRYPDTSTTIEPRHRILHPENERAPRHAPRTATISQPRGLAVGCLRHTTR